jgi:hypothetical protein
MTKRSAAGFAAVAMLFGSLACAGGMAREDDAAAAQQDTTEVQTPPGYSGMEQDTTQVPTDSAPTAVDTFLNEQGTGVPTDTMGYGGLEQPDTTGAAAGDTGTGMSDTTGTTGTDTSGTSGWSDTTNQSSWDTTGQQ